MACSLLPLYAQKKVVIDGVEYERFGVSGVKCRAKEKNNLVNVIIPTSIKIGDRNYLVTEIEREGFKGCKNLKSIEIPASVNNIGMKAFWDCTQLESVVMPDECKVKVYGGSWKTQA